MSMQFSFERTEYKFRLTPTQYFQILAGVKARCVPDEYPFSAITSVYYDTPDFLLTRRSLEKPAYKEKLRLRVYGPATASSAAFAEIKKKMDGVVYKRRTALNVREAQRWLGGETRRTGTQIEREIDRFLSFYPGLRPAILIACERDSFVSPDGALRLTFDRNIRYRAEEPDPLAGPYGALLLPEGAVLMEAKASGALPLWFARLLSGSGAYKTDFSKVGTAYLTMMNQICTGGKKYA